jgi:hypothetical protein
MLWNLGGGFLAVVFCDAQEQIKKKTHRPMIVAVTLVMVRLQGLFKRYSFPDTRRSDHWMNQTAVLSQQ